MAVFVQAFVNWLMIGGLYTLAAIGLSLVFSVMRIINFAHGQMYMLGAYAVYLAYGRAHVPYGLALLIAAIVVGVIGAVMERAIIRPVQGDDARAMVATLGALLAIGGLSLAVFGETDKYVNEPITYTLHVGPASVDVFKLLAGVVALLLTVGLFATLRWTRIGQSFRALAQDEEAARVQGVSIGRSRALGFAIGSGLAAVAGGLILPLTSARPDIGQAIVLKMFIILILGGLGRVGGAVAGAFALAAIETFGVTYIGQVSILTIYLLVIVILLVRPEGILGQASS